MARLIMQAFGLGGHHVAVASELRSFMRDPDHEGELDRIVASAEEEVDRITRDWRNGGVPDLWFTYHPYYKAPDLLGPRLCRHFGIPLINAEASYSSRRNIGSWRISQDMLINSLSLAATNICLTNRDRDGLHAALPSARLELIAPFINAGPYALRAPRPEPMRLVTVAMMRPGDKLSSYMALAESLALLPDLPWRLSIAGDGPCRDDVARAFASLGENRVEWLGTLSQSDIADCLARSAVFVWPGHGEAYGLAYLEAQAAGVPVVAEAIAGVPEVVAHGRTGLLTPTGDRQAFAAAVERLLRDEPLRSRLGSQAREFVATERSIDRAANLLNQIIRRVKVDT